MYRFDRKEKQRKKSIERLKRKKEDKVENQIKKMFKFDIVLI